MENKIYSLPLSEFGFVKLWSSLTIEYNDNNVIDRQELEKKLFDYYTDDKYFTLFNDITFINTNDHDGCADLYHGFTMSCILGIISEKDQNNPTKYSINLDLDTANQIISSYEQDIIIPMINLYEEIRQDTKTKTR